MFERFNESARRALFFSRYEAGRLGAEEIQSEHVLLGILRERDAVTSVLWQAMPDVPEQIARQYPTVTERVSPEAAAMRLSDEARSILAYAAENPGEVDPGHLLEAIFRVPESKAAKHLLENEIDAELLTFVMPSARQVMAAARPTPIMLTKEQAQFLQAVTNGKTPDEAISAILHALMSSDDLRDQLIARLRKL